MLIIINLLADGNIEDLETICSTLNAILNEANRRGCNLNSRVKMINAAINKDKKNTYFAEFINKLEDKSSKKK